MPTKCRQSHFDYCNDWWTSQARATRGEAAALVRSPRERTERHIRVSCRVHARGTSRSTRIADHPRPSLRGAASLERYVRVPAVAVILLFATCRALLSISPRRSVFSPGRINSDCRCSRYVGNVLYGREWLIMPRRQG